MFAKPKSKDNTERKQSDRAKTSRHEKLKTRKEIRELKKWKKLHQAKEKRK
jgi:hypothetical protein